MLNNPSPGNIDNKNNKVIIDWNIMNAGKNKT